MLPNITKGRGITGTVRYVLGQGKERDNNLGLEEKDRVAWISGQGFGFEIHTREDADLGRRIMEFAAAYQASRTKRCEKDALHLSLSWHPDELPTKVQMEQAARDALKALGMENARALFVAHNDKKHAHLHIVASRINPESGRAFSERNDFIKVHNWALEYELQLGVLRCPRRQIIDVRDPDKVLEVMTADRSTFTRRELERFLNKSVVSRLEVHGLADRTLAHDEVIGLRESADAPITRYTTRQVLTAEREILHAARELHRSTAHGVTDFVRDHVLDRHAHLDHEQRMALVHATNATGFAIVAGEAGTGKTATIEVIHEVYREAGYRVRGLAWTNSVVKDMKANGFADVATIAAEMKRLEAGVTHWGPRTVLIVDEAAMLATKTLAQLTDKARETGAKIILVGDDRQLTSIERGGMFSALRQKHGAAELHHVRRVADADQKRAFNRMHAGDFAAALEVFQTKGAIHWSKTQDASRDALVAKWAADTVMEPEKSRFIFAYTNADVGALNRDIRALRKERGELGADQILQTKDGPEAFAAGDRIQFTGNARRKSARDLGFTNGVAGVIREIDGVRVTVELDGKKSRSPRLVSFTVGDNPAAGQFNGLRHGYAGTIYKGQGRTIDETYLYHSAHWRRAPSYVALSRHRENTSIFVAQQTAPDLEQLARQMERLDDRRAASQFIHEYRYDERPSLERDAANRQEGERQARQTRLNEVLRSDRPERSTVRNDRKWNHELER